MECAPFLPLMRRLNDGKELEIRHAGGMAFSLPVVVRRGERQFDAMFLFERPDDSPEPTSPRPSAWVMLDASTGEVAHYSQCEIVDFMPHGRYEPGQRLPMQLPKLTVGKKRTHFQDRLLGAYDEIREFVFEENLTRPQAAAVSAYKDAFNKLIYSAHYPFYHALSPAFFHWLRMPLPKEALESPGQSLSDMQKDGYQLLILENLRQLVRQFQEKIATDTHKEHLFDKMHQELQAYRNGLLDELTQGIERDVIRIIDDLGKTADAYRKREGTPDDYRRLLSLFDGVETDLCDLLYRHGVEPYSVTEIDLARQKIIQTIPTSDEKMDKRIAARSGRGWEKQGKIIRHERISVYVYQPGDDR